MPPTPTPQPLCVVHHELRGRLFVVWLGAYAWVGPLRQRLFHDLRLRGVRWMGDLGRAQSCELAYIAHVLLVRLCMYHGRQLNDVHGTRETKALSEVS